MGIFTAHYHIEHVVCFQQGENTSCDLSPDLGRTEVPGNYNGSSADMTSEIRKKSEVFT